MDDDKNQPSVTSNQQSRPEDDQPLVDDITIGDSGKFKKETEPMPSATDFSELSKPHENNVEPEPNVENAENSDNSSQASNLPQNAQRMVEAKDSAKSDTSSISSTGKQYPLTKTAAQKILKGPLIFKNSSDPMLWLALLMVRHYQWLERQKKK